MIRAVYPTVALQTQYTSPGKTIGIIQIFSTNKPPFFQYLMFGCSHSSKIVQILYINIFYPVYVTFRNIPVRTHEKLLHDLKSITEV